MATFDNPAGSTTGTDQDDTFIFNRPLPPTAPTTLIVSGGAGRDTLNYAVGVVGQYRMTLAGDQLRGSVFHGESSFAFSEFEVIDFRLSSGFDLIVLTIEGATDPANIRIDGGGGSQGLAIEMANSAGLTFNVAGGAITSSVGTFSGFASFSLSLGSGNDTVVTGDGNDSVLVSSIVRLQGAGSDVVRTGGGDDRVSVSHFGGTFDGGSGLDTLDFNAIVNASSSFELRFGVGSDGMVTTNLPGSYTSFERFTFSLGSGNDGVITGAGDDRILGGGGDDYIQTGAGNDYLSGGSGTNTLIGGSGDDTYVIVSATDIIVEEPGGGYDTVFAALSFELGQGSNLEALTGVGGGSTLTGNELDNVITGGTGPDILIGRAGADALIGGTSDGFDTASYAGDGGAVFVNLTLGRGFTNTSFGDTYVDIDNVIGTDFDDFIIGNANANRLDGGAGNDIIIGAVGADEIVGGAGSDWASYEDNSGVVFVNLTLNQGSNNAAEGDTYSGIENLVGGLFDDFFIGDDNANRLDGAMGADTLLGAGGSDIFMFTYAPGATSAFGNPNVDLIVDFATGVDKIELSSAAFPGLAVGSIPTGAFRMGTAAGDADDRIIYDQSTGKLFFDPDGTGSQAALHFATLGENSHPAIAATDFVVV